MEAIKQLAESERSIKMKVYFVRHGETMWNKEKRLQGQVDIPLNEYGREMARLTRDGMKDISFDIAYTSPLCRAKETAQIILEGREIQICEDNRLLEMAFGSGEGIGIIEAIESKLEPIYSFICSPEQYIPAEGGESFDGLSKRCRQFLEEVIIPAESKHESILVTTHGGLICSLICYIEKLHIGEFWKGNLQKNCGVTILDCIDGNISISNKGLLFYDSALEV